MEVVITAVGPDNVGLADPIIHDVTSRGANIAEIQMYDHDEAAVFAMMCRLNIEASKYPGLVEKMASIAHDKELEIRVWSPDLNATRPRIAICTTLLEHTPRAILHAIHTRELNADPVVIIGNRRKCEVLAREYNVHGDLLEGCQGAGLEQAIEQESESSKLLTHFEIR
ncbi:MAG: formyltetrahydrofolate deformylase, partial [Pirellula sp.]